MGRKLDGEGKLSGDRVIRAQLLHWRVGKCSHKRTLYICVASVHAFCFIRKEKKRHGRKLHSQRICKLHQSHMYFVVSRIRISSQSHALFHVPNEYRSESASAHPQTPYLKLDNTSNNRGIV